MLRGFYLRNLNDLYDSASIHHIQVNIFKRLQFKYITFRRIDITLQLGSATPGFEIEWDDGKHARIILNFSAETLNDLESKSNFVKIYDLIHNSLIELWRNHNWHIEDVNSVFRSIQNEDYKVTCHIGKPLSSPDKKYKIRIYCEVNTKAANYFFEVVKVREKRKDIVLFFVGTANLDLFFYFFTKLEWDASSFARLTDLNREINFVFDPKNLTCEIVYSPIYNSIPTLKKYLSAFEPGVSSKERKRLLGLPT